MMSDYKNILVVRTDRIGDVVLSLPLAKIIKEKFPGCRITFLVRQYTKAVVEGNPYIDEVLTIFEEKNSFPILTNVIKIRSKKFDTAIIVYPTFSLALIIFLAGIKKRIGTGYRLYSFLFNKKVYEHRKYAEKHELEYNISLLSKIGINPAIGIDNVKFNLKIGESEKKKINELLRSKAVAEGELIVIVHPGSGGSAVDLPIARLNELVRMISGLNVKVIITGNEKEKKLCESISGEKNIILAGQLSLQELIALIDRSSLLIANSTGPIHLAAALNKYTIGFYPKILSCSAKRWGPYTKKKIVYEPEMECSNCTRKQCEELNCMNSISINRVFDDIKNILKKIS